MKTSQFCFSPRNFASRALTKNTMAWLTGVCSPCLGREMTIDKLVWSRIIYFLARATTLPLMKSTSD